MKAIQVVFWLHVAAGTGALAAGFALAGYWGLGLVFTLLGALWLASQARGIGQPAGLLLWIFLLAAAIGSLAGVPAWLALVSAVGTLGGWDLDHFLRRLGQAGRVNLDSGLGRGHLRRLLLVEAAGFAAGLAAVTIRTRLSFWWVALLVILAFAGISGLIAFVRRQVEQ